MSVKSNYFKMNQEDFKAYLNSLKSSSNVINVLDNKFFFVPCNDLESKVILLNKKTFELDYLVNSFTEFSKRQIVQSFLIDEIEATNKIESINSTRHDIFSLINASISKDEKIVSICNSYSNLLKSSGNKIDSIAGIRKLYDDTLKTAISSSDYPDGTYFRKGPVFITNGIKPVHKGILGEDKIIRLMKEFINLYNSNIELYTKMAICHFMFEYIHPYYDGNGRLGRFLFSNEIYLETHSYSSFLVALAFKKQKSKYYKSFNLATDKYEFGCLNEYVETIFDILLKQIGDTIEHLGNMKNVIASHKQLEGLTKSETKIYDLINEASLLSYFGISNEEIMKETGVSKRTLIYSLNKFRKEVGLIDTKLGRYTYHMFNIASKDTCS